MTTATSALFDVTEFSQTTIEGVIERVPLEHFKLARNPRQDISPEGIDRLAGMLMRTGQLVPVIARRVSDDEVLLYAGQRRLLAGRRSVELAGTEGYEDLKPVAGLIALLLNYEPTEADVRRIQAQENQREDLSMRDQQEQFRDCWDDRAGLSFDDRMRAVCEDLGIGAKKAHNLYRQVELLPETIRIRVSDRPAGDQLSVTMANKLADMNQVAPQLTTAVAERISSTNLHDQALKDLGAFVHKTVVENDKVYAVRIDDGTLLDAVEQIEHARNNLTPQHAAQLVALLECEDDELEKELDGLASRAKAAALTIRVDGNMRDRAANGRYAYVHQRGEDFADGIWVIDPVFILDEVRTQLAAADAGPERDESFFGGAKLDDEEMKEAAEAERKRRQEAAGSNLGLGQDIAAGLMDPSDQQLHALKKIVCLLLAEHYPEVIAYGAGWTDRSRQQPVGDTSRFEPRQVAAILDAELQRALDDKDPLRGIAQLVSRWAAAFVLDPTGVTKTKALGSDRMSRKLLDALPGGDSPLRTAVWEFIRPVLSPHLVALNQDAFVTDDAFASTVDLDEHRKDSSLDDLDLELGDDDQLADAA